MDLAADLDFDYIEFCTGGWSTSPHIDIEHLVADADVRAEFQQNWPSAA
jgi:hypothetical protein